MGDGLKYPKESTALKSVATAPGRPINGKLGHWVNDRCSWCTRTEIHPNPSPLHPPLSPARLFFLCFSYFLLGSLSVCLSVSLSLFLGFAFSVALLFFVILYRYFSSWFSLCHCAYWLALDESVSRSMNENHSRILRAVEIRKCG